MPIGHAVRSLRTPIANCVRLASQHAPTSSKPIFFDMVHSNNAARVRLWMQLKKPGGMEDLIETRMVTYPDLQTAAFAAVNPLKKVPALIRSDGTTVFESQVILNYLEDKYKVDGVPLEPPTPEGRQAMHLLNRIHDLYIASPNTTAPGFSHSQGAMYLSTGWHGPARGMCLATRAAKIGEIWRQLNWLEAEVAKQQAAGGGGPYMLGQQLTLADLTWFPTCVFMEYLLPKFFGCARRPSARARWLTGPDWRQLALFSFDEPLLALIGCDAWRRSASELMWSPTSGAARCWPSRPLAPPRTQRHCATAPLRHCATAPLRHCATAPLRHCATAR